MDEMKKLLEELQRTFEAFKKANDEALKQLKENGVTDPLLTQQVNALNTKFSELEQKYKQLETEHARVAALGGPTPSEAQVAERQAARHFLAEVTNRQVDQVREEEINLEEFRNYRRGFFNYIRSGRAIDVRSALSVGNDRDGGYVVPPDTSGRIIKKVFEQDPWRSVVTVSSTASDRKIGLTDLAEVDAGWVGEQEDRDETDADDLFGEYEIVIHEQHAQPRVTQKLLDDAALDIEAFVVRKVGEKFGRNEGVAITSGDGIKKPRGILTYDDGTTWGKIEQLKTGVNGAFAAADPGDKLIDVVYSLKGFYRAAARWAMNPVVVAEVRKLKDGDDNYLWQPDFTQLSQSRLLGFPIIEIPSMPVLAAGSLSIAFGDYAEAYELVDRAGIRLLRDPYTKKGHLKLYTVRRLGGQVVNFEAIKLLKFAA